MQRASLCELFNLLLKKPENFKNTLFVTMPEDEDYEAYKTYAANDAVKFYECPNGHLYAIGECAQPVQQSSCPTCKSTIGSGAAAYQLAAGNRIAQNINDTTKFGYCLLDAYQRSDNSESIREMSPLHTSLLRLILTSTLYISAITGHQQAVSQLITSYNVPPKDVSQYLADKQILKDIRILSNCLQHSIDESLLLVHFMLNKIINLPKAHANSNMIGHLKKIDESSKTIFVNTFSVLYLGTQVEEIITSNDSSA